MSKVICLISPKGGSGKTVLTASFAALIRSLNKKVLIIDIDASTNGLTLLYLKEVIACKNVLTFQKKMPIGIYEASEGKTADIVSLSNGVDLMPAAFSFVNTENSPPKSTINYLQNNVLHYKKQYDFIFLDAQAGSDSFAQHAINAEISDEIIIVSEYDPLSAAGVERLKAFFREQLTFDRTWVLLNKMLPEFARGFNDFLDVAKYLCPIPWDADVVRAYSRRQLALNLETGNEFTLAILQNLKTLLNEELIEEINEWSAGRAQLMKKPIENQLSFFERKLDSLLRIQMQVQQNIRLKKTFDRVFTFSAFITFSATIAGLFIFLQNKNYGKTIAVNISIILSILAVATFLKLKALKKKSYYDKMVNSCKLEREIRILEERLKKLDALRYAELEMHFNPKERSHF